MFLLYVVEASMHLLSQRMIQYGDMLKGKRLMGNHSKTQFKTSKPFCAFLCLITPECLSFNTCSPEKCELNQGDKFSMQAVLENHPACSYVGMKRDYIVQCQQKGVPESVRDDSDYDNLCQVNLKRIDGQWINDRHEVQVDSADVWKKVLFRDCFQPSHGGKECEGGSQIDLEWMKFVSEELNWHSAKQNCINLGGHLFDDVNGTLEQLHFLVDKLGPDEFYLGVYTDDDVIWRDMKGKPIPGEKLRWTPGEPSANENVALVRSTGLNNVQAWHEKKSVCDLRVD